MNFPASVTFLFLYFVCISSHAVAKDDIFATPASTPTMKDRYPTAAAFLAATRNGEIPEMFRHNRYNAESDLGRAVFYILINEYGFDKNEANNGGPNLYSSDLGSMLKCLTDHEFNLEDKDRLVVFQNIRKILGAKVTVASDKFAVQYDNAVKEYVAFIQQKGKQVAEEQRKRDIETGNAREARKQKLADVLASPTSKLWEAASQIQQGEEMISNAQRVLDHDDAVQHESGVTDLAARRAAGEQMVAGKNMVETAFSTYKKLGGKAATPEEVVAGPDPAAEYR